MAPISKSLAVAGAFFALSGLAAPLEKRAVVWETVTSVVWTTVEVTTTVWPDQPATTPAAAVTTSSAVPTTTTPAVVQSEPTPSEAAQTLQQVQKQEAVVPPVISTTQPAQAPAPEPTEQPTTSVAPEPAPEPSTTSTPAPVETTTPVNAPVAPAGGGSGGSSSYSGPCSKDSPCTGEVTFYDTATSKDSPSFCETTNDGESENVLALPVGIVSRADCGKKVVVSYKGVTETATVIDKCMGCANTALDLSRHLFKALGSFDEGRLSGVKWHFQ